jgi:hypothetical protein
MIVLSERLAEHEDALDRVREVLDELRADVADELDVDLLEVVERLHDALAIPEG